MSDEKLKQPLSKKMKSVFIAGILTCLPIVVTVYIILFLYRLLTGDIIPILRKVAGNFDYPMPTYSIDLLALVLVFVFIFLIGLIAKAYLGKQVIKLIDYLMCHIPIAKTIYKSTKQVIDSVSATSGGNFSKVVLVEFPRRDMWMIGFVVKDSLPFMKEVCGYEEAYNIFVPTAPNPTSGFAAIVSKSDVREIDITVEDGVKFVFSVGLVNLSPMSSAEAHATVTKMQCGHDAK